MNLYRKTQNPQFLLASLFLVLSGFVSCGDPVIQDYIEDYAVQGLLTVGEPLQGIIVSKTLNIVDTLKLANQVLRDADVRVRLGNREWKLAFMPDTANGGSYGVVDASVRVLPDTVYSLYVKLANGREMTGQTRTPKQIRWLTGKEPKPLLQYPKDTATLPAAPDSLSIAWEAVPGINDYIFGILCLDTANYGKYLTPPDTAQKNRRVYSTFADRFPRYPEVIRYGFITSTKIPVVWVGFKWFGPHEIIIYAPDANWLNWFRQTNQQGQSPRYDKLLGSIKGGYGVFGSISATRQRMFLLKNQP